MTEGIGLRDAEFLRVLVAARESGAIVNVHAENGPMLAHARAACLREGQQDVRHYAASRPPRAEVDDPFHGMSVRGTPVMTLSRGEVIAREGELLSRPGRGHFVARTRGFRGAANSPDRTIDRDCRRGGRPTV